MPTIASLELLRLRLGLASTDNSEDSRLLAALEAASSTIERETNRHFLPYQASILHSIQRHFPQEILLKDDLLSLQSLTNGDGTAISLDECQILDGVLRLLNGQRFVYTESPENAIAVSGIWGFHPAWEKAWKASGDTVQASPLSESATSLPVTDADAGSPARFQVGQLLKIEEEYCFVLAVDAGTNTLTIERGAQGTTAATHANGTSIEIYQVPHDLQSLCLAWAHWLYQEGDNLHAEMPSRLREEIKSLRRVRV